MATKRKKLNPSIKKRIMEEAGNKCSNPGCSNWRTHIHHIKHWAIYESDDEEILIPVCPTCHDYIHHGTLDISDDTLYNWKGAVRKNTPKIAHIFCEPIENPKIYFGTIFLRSKNSETTIINISDSNFLKFRVIENEINLIKLKMSDLISNEILSVSENFVKLIDDSSIDFDSYPGRVRITTKQVDRFLSKELLRVMRVVEPTYAREELILLDIEVKQAGKIQMQGCWVKNDKAFLVTDKALHLVTEGASRPATFVGKNDECGIIFTGDITQSLFVF